MLVQRILRLPFDLYKAALRWSDDDGMLLSASTAYYAIFSLFPLLLVLMSVMGFILYFSAEARDVEHSLPRWVAEHFSEGLAEHTRNLLGDGAEATPTEEADPQPDGGDDASPAETDAAGLTEEPDDETVDEAEEDHEARREAFLETRDHAERELLKILAENFSDEFADYLGQLLSDIRTKAAIGGPIGLISLLFGAIGIFSQVDAAFHRIWRVPISGHRWYGPFLRMLWRRFRGFVMLLAMGGLVIASYLSQPIVAGARALVSIPHVGPYIEHFTSFAVIVAINVFILAVIYRVLPKRKVTWFDALSGALLTAVLWNGVRLLLTVILGQSRYTAYGLFGAVIIVMLWFYIASGLFYLGAEYIAVVSNVDEKDRPPLKPDDEDA